MTFIADFSRVIPLSQNFNKAHLAAKKDSECEAYAEAMDSFKEVLAHCFLQDTDITAHADLFSNFGEKATKKADQIWKKWTLNISKCKEPSTTPEDPKKIILAYHAAFNTAESNDNYKALRETKKAYHNEILKLLDKDILPATIIDKICAADSTLKDSKAESKVKFLAKKHVGNFFQK